MNFKHVCLIFVGFLSSCAEQSKDRTQLINADHISTVDSLMPKDSTLFMFEFKVLNMNSRFALDSIRNSLDTIQGLKGYALSIPKKSTIFYCSEFDAHKSLISAIRNAGYTMDDIFTMKGPGLTCDIPAEPVQSNESPTINNVLANLDNIKKVFNDKADKVRVISLPNPSCLACVKGQRFVNSLFKDSFSTCDDLFGITVWLSINGWGSLDDALRLAPEISDHRMTNFWDEQAAFGKMLKSPLSIKEEYHTAWDVYLIYDKGVLWEEDIPTPSFWMHQLTEESSGVKKSNFMDHSTFSENLSQLLENCNEQLKPEQLWNVES